MESKNNKSELFNQNGCLSRSAIARLIDQKLDEKELQKVLSHLDVCPLCKDAVEGISGIGAGQFIKDMNRLRTGFSATSADKGIKNRLRLISMISAATSVIVVLGVLFLYHRIQLNADKTIAQSVEKSGKTKEKASYREESGPLNESSEMIQPEKEKMPVTKSESPDRAPVMETDAEAAAGYEPAPDTVYAEVGISMYDQAAEPAAKEETMELSDERSASADISLSAGASDQKRIKSAVNTGFIPEDAAKQSRSALPARDVLLADNEKPLFRGSDVSEFVNYLQDHLKSTEQPLNEISADSILISFVVDTLGRPVNIKIINQINPETEKEILRLFRSSPDWLPGKENGIRINTGYTILVRIHPGDSE